MGDEEEEAVGVAWDEACAHRCRASWTKKRIKGEIFLASVGMLTVSEVAVPAMVEFGSELVSLSKRILALIVSNVLLRFDTVKEVSRMSTVSSACSILF